MSDRKPPTRHPSTAIPDETVAEISHRVYLRRLEPPMMPEESVATVYRDKDGKVTSDDTTRRKHSASYSPLTRAYLRVLVDMGIVKP